MCTPRRPSLGEHGLHLALAKAEVAQGGEDLCVRVDEPWVYWLAVSGAVRMAEDQSAVVLALDELTAMDGSVMSSAQGQKVFGLVAAAFCLGLDVVHVDERRVGAAWDAATVSIAREHGATQRWRDALSGARARMRNARAHVGVA